MSLREQLMALQDKIELFGEEAFKAMEDKDRHADRKVNVNYDETGLTDAQLNDIHKQAIAGKYPITDAQRSELVQTSMNIVRLSESTRDVNQAVKNLLAMDKHNVSVDNSKKSGRGAINIALVRQEILAHAGLLESSRRAALDSDTSSDDTILIGRKVEDGPSLEDIGQSVGGGFNGEATKEGVHGTNSGDAA